MTDFDFYLAFLLPILCGFHNCRMSPELYQEFLENLTILKITEDTLESASLYHINPTDAVRLAVAVENALDGIITWEPSHFAQRFRDREIIEREHQAHVFVASSIDVETGRRVEVRMFVSSVNAFFPNQAQDYWQSYGEPTRSPIPYLRLHGIELTSYSSCLEEESCIKLTVYLEDRSGEIKSYSSSGIGLINTLFDAIGHCASQFFDFPTFDNVNYSGPVSGRIDGMAQVHVCITRDYRDFQGIGIADDLLMASARAYIDSINNLLMEEIG